MNTEQNHIIQYEVFDIDGCTRARAKEMQNRVSRLAGEKLNSVMEEVLDRLAGPATLVKIDQLVLDMGVIPYEHFEELFMERFAGILEKELSARLATLFPVAAGTREEQKEGWGSAYLSLLEYFLVNGALPWWASGKLLNDPSPVMDLLLREESASLRSMIQRVGEAEYVRRRLVYQFPVTVIHGLLKILEPAQAVFILGYHSSLSKVQQLERVLPAEESEFRQAVWLFILDYLLVDQGNQFNRKEFVRHTLSRMARHFNRDYIALLGLFAAILPTDDPVFQLTGALPSILKELAVEEGAFEATVPDESVEKARALQKKRELIRYYLIYGSLPPWAFSIHQTELSGIFVRIIQQIPGFVKEMLRSLHDLPPVPWRIAVHFDETITHSLIELLEPSGAPVINSYLKSLPFLQQQQPLVHAGYKDFGQAIRGVALGFLLSERGSVFNTKMFLASNIRGVARHFNLQYGELLAGLLRGWEQESQSGAETSFLPLLRTLLEEEEKSEGTSRSTGGIGLRREEEGTGRRKEEESKSEIQGKVEAEREQQKTAKAKREQQAKEETEKERREEMEIKKRGKAEKEAGRQGGSETGKESEIRDKEESAQQKATEAKRAQRAKDILRYWLHHDRLPWWGEDPATSPEVIWRELMERSPRSIHSLLQFAGVSTDKRDRLIRLLSPGLLLAGFRLLPGGEMAARNYHSLLLLTGEEGALRIRSDAQQRILLLQALWDTGVEGAYSQWNVLFFVRRSILRLAGWTGLYPFTIAHSLWRAAIRGNVFSYSSEFLAALRELSEGSALTEEWGRIGREWEEQSRRQMERERQKGKKEEEREQDPGDEEQQDEGDGKSPWQEIWERKEADRMQEAEEQEARWEKRKRNARDDMGPWEMGAGEGVSEEEKNQQREEREYREEQEYQKERNKREERRMEGTIYIRNSGLVLLHPLLNTYFSRLDCLGPDGFAGEAARFRAVHLLQYLVNGTEEHPEQELALNKILCGMPVDEPLPLSVPLTEKEKEVSAELLNVVRMQWEKMKNTSTEGLQGAFLQRQGALMEAEDGWKLRVEQRVYDPLLETLPWGFGMIKLSWMKKILYTEWSY